MEQYFYQKWNTSFIFDKFSDLQAIFYEILQNRIVKFKLFKSYAKSFPHMHMWKSDFQIAHR